MSETLSKDRIEFLLSNTKQRGVYEASIDEAAKSGALATNVSLQPYFKGKDVAAVRNSFNGNIEKHTKENEWPAFTVVIDKSDTTAEADEDGNYPDTKDKTKWHVILVNLDVLAAMQAVEA